MRHALRSISRPKSSFVQCVSTSISSHSQAIWPSKDVKGFSHSDMDRTWIFSQRCYTRMVWMWKVLCVVAVDVLSQIWTLRTLIGALNAFAGGLPGLQDMKRIKCISIDDLRCHKVNLTGTCEIVGMKWQAACDFDLSDSYCVRHMLSEIRWSDPRTQPVYSGSMWLYIDFI